MLVLKEDPYPSRVQISFYCDYDNTNLYFLRSRILADISVLLILAIIKMLSFVYAHWPCENC